PMMDWTDRHYRYFMRAISSRAVLYTEMIPSSAIIHGDRQRFLDFHTNEHPLVLQLGGSDPAELAECCRLARQAGYDEVNLNVGCPSNKVQRGRFGARLMLEPGLVAQCITAMQDASPLPVSVKCRAGLLHHDSDQFLTDFVGPVQAAGCKRFIIHARIAVLEGLSPKANRAVPPLQYDRVERLKKSFPHLALELNGGLVDWAAATRAAVALDGIMLGRAAYENPWLFHQADAVWAACNQTKGPDASGDNADPNQSESGPGPGRPGACHNRAELLERMVIYMDRLSGDGLPMHAVTRHMLGLFHECPGARYWRRVLSDPQARSSAKSPGQLFQRASARIPAEILLAGDLD
ncbi:MAG: tRNA dihydrouridine(20/20a) synthase DusA, partial [Leptospiraceae bacterium]|nr:tRNA dihydrouridine(20/20a) synthase DusA [Leptospiraceae bacterium]